RNDSQRWVRWAAEVVVLEVRSEELPSPARGDRCVPYGPFPAGVSAPVCPDGSPLGTKLAPRRFWLPCYRARSATYNPVGPVRSDDPAEPRPRPLPRVLNSAASVSVRASRECAKRPHTAWRPEVRDPRRTGKSYVMPPVGSCA